MTACTSSRQDGTKESDNSGVAVCHALFSCARRACDGWLQIAGIAVSAGRFGVYGSLTTNRTCAGGDRPAVTVTNTTRPKLSREPSNRVLMTWKYSRTGRVELGGLYRDEDDGAERPGDVAIVSAPRRGQRLRINRG